MKNKVCIAVLMVILGLCIISVKEVKAVKYSMNDMIDMLDLKTNVFKIGDNITDYMIFRDKNTGEEIPVNWVEVVNEVDNGVIEVNGNNAIVKREGDSAITYSFNYDGEEYGFTQEVTAVGDSKTTIDNQKFYLFLKSPIIKTQVNETEEVFTFLDIEPADSDFDWGNGLPEVELEWNVANSEIATLEETTKYYRGIVIKPIKRGNTKLTCTVKIPTTGETIVKTAYIMVADENGNYDELIEDDTAPEILNIQVNGYTIKVEAKDNEAGLAEKAYSLDGENWQSSNEFIVNKPEKYTIYVCDVAGNIATKTVEVVIAKEDKTPTEDNKTEKEDNADEKKTQDEKENKNNNSKNADNKTSTETKNVEKTEDKTQAKTVIPQTGAAFPIVILIVVFVIGIVGYKKFKKINY